MRKEVNGPMANAAKNSRKVGRNKEKCKRYQGNGTREANKKLDLVQHLRDHETDESAKKALFKLSGAVRGQRYKKKMGK
jgi:hypothetical protein